MIIQARVKTGQKRFVIVKKSGFWEICVRSRPERNQANHEIVNELSKVYGAVRILKGHRSSKKVIEL